MRGDETKSNDRYIDMCAEWIELVFKEYTIGRLGRDDEERKRSLDESLLRLETPGR